MTNQLRQLLRAYMSRRSPWGPPWWIYGVAFGTANLVRQGLIIVTAAEIPQPVQVASWVVTALAVIAVVNAVAVSLRRRGDATGPGQAPTLAPTWPLRHPKDRHREPDTSPANADRSDHPTESVGSVRPRATEGGHTVMNQQRREPVTASARWAPWWAYLVIVIGANYLRRAVLPDGSTPAVRVVVALAFSAVLFVAITAIHRGTLRPDHARIAQSTDAAPPARTCTER